LPAGVGTLGSVAADRAWLVARSVLVKRRLADSDRVPWLLIDAMIGRLLGP
jgi:hypothetical protein